ncbi:MAG: hypothetical protein U0790_20475 [Isosphaeraceae bacterium]
MAVGNVHVSLTETGNDQVELRYWTDNPNTARTRKLSLREIGDLVERAETEYYGGPVKSGAAAAEAVSDRAERLLTSRSHRRLEPAEIGRQLFSWLDGTDRWLVRTFKDIGHPVIALAIEARQRLGHLPWELLHDGTSFLVHGANPAVLPVRWRPQKVSHRATQNRALNVLFMATSPEGTRELAFEEEGKILRASTSRPYGSAARSASRTTSGWATCTRRR